MFALVDILPLHFSNSSIQVVSGSCFRADQECRASGDSDDKTGSQI